jgi:hypothetical protein
MTSLLPGAETHPPAPLRFGGFEQKSARDFRPARPLLQERPF